MTLFAQAGLVATETWNMATRRDDGTAKALLVIAVVLALAGGGTAAVRSSDSGASMRTANVSTAAADACAKVPAATPVATTGGPAIELLATPRQMALPQEFGPDSSFLIPVRYASVDQYVKATQQLLPAVWRAAMVRNGFATAVVTQYKSGTSLVDAEALRFGSPEQAADFNHDVESALCQARITRVLTPVAGAPGAVVSTYRNAGAPPYRASLVAGDTVVHLGVCRCAVPPGSSPLEVTATWARAVFNQLNRAGT